jgi:hypothetical protein
VAEPEWVTNDKVLETIRAFPGGLDILIQIYKYNLRGKGFHHNRIDNPRFCSRVLPDFLHAHMNVKFNGKFYENLQLRSGIDCHAPTSHTLKDKALLCECTDPDKVLQFDAVKRDLDINSDVIKESKIKVEIMLASFASGSMRYISFINLKLLLN